MVPFPHNQFQVRRLASGILLLLIAFQLGACPCGCVEHNAWFQMLGLSGEHEHFEGSVAEPFLVDASHHDCTGDEAAPYLDSARSSTSRSHEEWRSQPKVLFASSEALPLESSRARFAASPGLPPAHLAAPARIELQIFLI